VLAETDSTGNWTNYIFFGGQRLARNVPQPSPNPADIKYYITDHLHSTGIFADKTGTVLDDNDFYPWGGVVPGVGQTTSNNTIKFTGQYRDTDTAANLDYFGARYYSNTIGRFMNPDWAAAPVTVPYAKFGDPQSLNLYSYVENGPVNRIDADGHSAYGVLSYAAETRVHMGEGPTFDSGDQMTKSDFGPAPDAAALVAAAEEENARIREQLEEEGRWIPMIEGGKSQGHTIGPFSFYDDEPDASEVDKAATRAHEKQHQADFWNLKAFTLSCGELEYRGFQAEIPIYQNRINQLKAKGNLTPAEKAELADDITELGTAQAQTPDMLNKVYSSCKAPSQKGTQPSSPQEAIDMYKDQIPWW
jgi:RHS repeat-associated protein